MTLIAVDWGTTSCRSTLLGDNGATLFRKDNGPGILAVTDGNFAGALTTMIGPWRAMKPEARIVLSGMIGSRQGWVEAPYVACPAGLTDIAARLVTVDAPDLGRVEIVPGLMIEVGGVPDVMRGEETQVFGAGITDGLCVLPGTHSKWATVSSGRITGFATYMTGEVYAALKDHTILGRLMTPAPSTTITEHFLAAVKQGAATGHPGALLQRIFATRTLGLFDRLPADALADHLSGLLIGAEIAAASHNTTRPITIIANDELTRRYSAAAATLRLVANPAPPHCAERGAFAIAAAAASLSGVHAP
jgi:2-dehydro-3-deoxygalactonokinase